MEENRETAEMENTQEQEEVVLHVHRHLYPEEKELKKAKKASADQYESMKLRIAYMYENAGTSALETLLSSESLAEFLNRAENAIQISTYDRDMLDKYVSLQKNIQ